MEASFDVVVIGAGPAGCIAASRLLKEGFSVLVLEREVFPRFVIGESLLPRCMDLLDEADLLEVVHREGFQVKDGAVFLRGDERVAFQFSQQFTQGWSYTYQVQRARFDHILAKAVEERGAVVRFRTSVIGAATSPSAATLTVREEDGTTRDINARFIIDASGYGRVLPRLLDLEAPSHLPRRRALFSHVRREIRPPAPETGRIWIVSHPDHEGVWFWVIPFADRTTSVGVVAEPSLFEQFQGTDEDRLVAIMKSDPNIARRIPTPEFLFPPRAIEGYSAGVSKLYGDRFAIVGNAGEFLDPIFSSGVTLALESSTRAALLVGKQLRGEVADWEGEFESYVRSGVDVFRSYVTSWYEGTLPTIIYNSGQREDVMTKICSVLAGYVWDQTNPFVRDHRRKIRQLAALCLSPSPFEDAVA